MAAFLCRVCGGALELISGESLCRCPHCGTMQSVPLLDSEEKTELCRRAEQLRREFRYDKAMALYERLIRLSPADADLYWALTLCRFGAELSADGGMLLNRICAHSVLSDEDYKLALKFADDEARAVMERQAEQIDIARRSGLELAGNADYDVYLCAREADENGRRALDSVIAAELYKRLCAEGFKVFFPQKSLEDEFGGAWEPHIFAALSSAAVMIVVGTSAESFDEVWVRNAWSRFSRAIIPVVSNVPPGGLSETLPEELAGLQVLDMSRLGAENDLIGAIRALTGKKPEAPEAPGADDPMLRRAALFLEDGDFGKAEEIAAQLLAKSPNNAEAYVIKLLAEYGLPNENALDSVTTGFSDSENYRLAMLHGGEPLRRRLKEHLNRATEAAPEDSDPHDKHREIYENAVKALSESGDVFELSSAERNLRSLGDYEDAPALAETCAAKIAELSKNGENSPRGESEYKQKNRLKKYLPFAAAGAAVFVLAVVIAVILTHKPKASADVLPIENIADSQINLTDDEKDKKYAEASAAFENGNYSEAELMFSMLGDYSDAAEMVNECKYQSAAVLLEGGELDAAERAFERLGEYSDSPEMILQCKYQRAKRLLENGSASSAREIFVSLDGKWESGDFIRQIDYASAEGLLDSGEYKAARDAFKALGRYSDSAERSKEAWYKFAAELLENGEYYNAAVEFEKLEDYSDSGTQYCRAHYERGVELLEQNNLRAARDAFAKAKGYGDTAAQLRRLRKLEIKSGYLGDFGEYYYVFDNKKSPMTWGVVSVKGDMALVYGNIIEYMPFDESNPNCTWQNSSLRRWLNGEFYENAFSAEEKAMIRTSVFETSSGSYNYIGGSEMGGNGISDKVFLLSTAEVDRNFAYYGDLDKTYLTFYAQDRLAPSCGTLFCWGRDRPMTDFYDDRGNLLQTRVNATTYNCVMPAMWIYIGD